MTTGDLERAITIILALYERDLLGYRVPGATCEPCLSVVRAVRKLRELRVTMGRMAA